MNDFQPERLRRQPSHGRGRRAGTAILMATGLACLCMGCGESSPESTSSQPTLARTMNSSADQGTAMPSQPNQKPEQSVPGMTPSTPSPQDPPIAGAAASPPMGNQSARPMGNQPTPPNQPNSAGMPVPMGPTDADCSTLPNRQQCDRNPACWYGAPGCVEGQDQVALPPRLSGCQTLEIRCEDSPCPMGEACTKVINDPCAGRLCEACGELIQVCVSETRNAPACGGNRPVCPVGTYCRFNSNDLCGIVGRPGRCQPLPQDCPPGCQEVCGCDGQTYCNACIAASEGRTDVRFSGLCPVQEPPPDNRCLQQTHPNVRVVARGDACNGLDLQCPPDEMEYRDTCSCGCLSNGGQVFQCANDEDCVPEDCCRPTGCVSAQAAACQHDEIELGCFASDCRPAIEACGCFNGLCRTKYDENRCE